MKPKPTSETSAPFKFVIVTLDNHISSAVDRSREELSQEIPGLELSVFAAADFSDAHVVNKCVAAIADADIVFANMLFLEEHIQAVLPALTARREACMAMVCAMSASEVMKLTKMGSFKMDGSGSGGPMALLKKLKGMATKKKDEGKGDSGARQMAMVKRLPKLLRFIPGTAQDVRIYMLVLAYWLAGSRENLADLIRTLVNRYADGEHRALRGALNPGPPREYPENGVYHPDLPERMVDSASRLPSPKDPKGTIGIVVMRSYVLAGDSRHYDAVIRELEGRGFRVIPCFASGLDSRPAIEKYFFDDKGNVTIDAILSLTGFSLVGGPAFNDAKAGEEILARLDRPYVAATPLELQTIDSWRASSGGLTSLEATLMVALPELDGATGSIVFGGRDAKEPTVMTGVPERIPMLGARLEKLVRLRRAKLAERHVGIVLFNFPPNGGATGTAAYLSVFESLHRVLGAMKAEGYTVDVPPTVAALRDRVLGGNAGRYGTDANVVAHIAVDDHVRNEPYLAEIEKQWGPAPGKAQTDGSSIFVLGERFGNVLVGIQPAFGYEGDPMRLLFEAGFAPTHAFSAFYRYLRDDFGAHALLHFGTHGALEFMPGKQAGLGPDCWPDRLISDLPNLYLYAANNPAEGAVARRRAAATLVSHMTPPVSEAGLYRGLITLKESLDHLRSLPPGHAEVERLVPVVQSQAALLELASAEPAWVGSADKEIAKLGGDILELEQTLIPCGLHILGEPMAPAARIDTLTAMADGTAIHQPPRAAVEAIVAGNSAAFAIKAAGLDADKAVVDLYEEMARVNGLLSVNPELPALMHAIGGGFVRPAPGGDLLRTPAVLPTGRNLHGFDPFAIPSAFAVLDGAEQAARLLARHIAEGNPLPESVALVLWGADNLKSGGGPIGQALALMGARPRFDSYGRLCGARLLSLDELGRPRIDVLITLSGIFRDLLPLQTRLLAEAAYMCAAADEPLDLNFVRRHALAHQSAHGGDLETAALRVFCNADGAYGSNVNQLIDSGVWQNEDELAQAYTSRKSFAYGKNGGPPSKQENVLKSVLSNVQLTYQNVESVELGVTSLDQYFDTLGGVSRAARREQGGKEVPVYIGDQTRSEGKVRTLTEQVALESRTRALNPKWTEEMLKHGAEGVRQIEAQVTNTLGWSATTGQVDTWVYRELAQTYVLDGEMRDRIAELNPKAAMKLANRLIEASERNYWTPDPAMLEALRDATDEIEDRLEGLGDAAPTTTTTTTTTAAPTRPPNRAPQSFASV